MSWIQVVILIAVGFLLLLLGGFFGKAASGASGCLEALGRGALRGGGCLLLLILFGLAVFGFIKLYHIGGH